MQEHYDYYSNLVDSNSETRHMHHNMKNHLILIKKTYSSKEISQNNDIENKNILYLDNLINKLDSIYIEFDTGSYILDTILYENKKLFDDKNIQFMFSIQKCNYDSFDDIDLCNIFSNIFDNAFEACNKIKNNKEKFVKFDIMIIKGILRISCTNSKVNPIIKRWENIITDKKHPNLHGLGLKNIGNSVSKYGGDMRIFYKDHIFNISIIIPLKE
ncbi:MAG: GHKL domain-containing protein [Clostridioides sp.]|jgi:hypothetical protein|nr:GHKL domain-containing protein [Clostridioides sp.]